jgi:DNA-binding NarL/FixJ family response regulator
MGGHQSASTTTVVLADSQPAARSGLRTLLAAVDGIDVVAEAATGRDAIRETLLRRPTVLLLDLQLDEPDGITAVTHVRRAAPDTAVLAVTTRRDDHTVLAAIRAGVHGYLHKEADRHSIVRAIHAVAAGEAIFDRTIADRVIELLINPPPRTPFPDLTPREREVLDLIAAGLPNPAIARRLHLARKTVSNNISAIVAKLQVRDRAQLVATARDGGLGRPASRTHAAVVPELLVS